MRWQKKIHVFFFSRIHLGGKKNRQKERRLMKGFNLAPPTTPATTLPPVAEFMSPYQQGQSDGNSEMYGSTFSGIVGSGITPRRNHMYSMQQFSSSQSSFSESLGNIGKLGKLGSKLRHSTNNASHKRRWGKVYFIH